MDPLTTENGRLRDIGVIDLQVISDDRGFLMLPKARQRDGFVRRDSPDQAKRWGDRFNELWASSQTDPALRRFLL